MLKDIKNILITVLFIIVAILLFQVGCNKPEIDLKPKTSVLVKSDTVWGKDTIYQLKVVYKPKNTLIYKIDTIKYPISADSLYFVREYSDSLVDTNQTVYYKAKTLGILDELDISYKLKVPIKITDSVFTNTTTIVTKQPKLSIYAGIETGGNLNSFNISPYLDLNIKNNTIGYRYGILDETHNIKVGIKLYKSKK